ncbi:MAG: PAS domain-containing protein [Alphaproteobacteria bacterium]|nr:PAS domain-containing protein [Alphaproteobacteria bacterium]MBU0831819.1 PAS domain-containing protein [Alphaproteobacteria bacterium]MBU1765688.1 PAS domain-containing protein [Alphaproteobacteria bacterium]
MSDQNSSRRDAQDAGDRLLASHSSEDPFAAAFKATRMPMLITDPRQSDNPIIFCNQAFSNLTGYSTDELIGRNCRLLQGPETDIGAIARLREAISAERDLAIDILNYRKDGSQFWNALFVSPVRDADGEVVYFFASQLDFTTIKSKELDLAEARQSAEREVARRTHDLSEALKAQTLLVHEVDHRVKNNLLTIASIVKLQARMSEDDLVKRTLFSVLNRVEALSTVQRKLFTSSDLGRFDVSDFAKDLIEDLVGALKRDDIRVTTDLSPVLVPAVKASPLALIINELVLDAVRRGLSDGGGDIHLQVRRTNGHFVIRVTDTTKPVSVNPVEEAFGRLMLETCAKQLDAKIGREVEGYRTDVQVTMLVEDAKETDT